MHHPSEKLDILEHGAPVDGKPQTSDRRLYMQLQVFTGVKDVDAVSEALDQSGLDAALYLDVQGSLRHWRCFFDRIAGFVCD